MNECKFKNFDALLKSYKELESAFTKKCQELSKLEKADTKISFEAEVSASVPTDADSACATDVKAEKINTQEAADNASQPAAEAGGVDAQEIIGTAQADATSDSDKNNSADSLIKVFDNDRKVTENQDNKVSDNEQASLTENQPAKEEAEQDSAEKDSVNTATSPAPADYQKDIEKFFSEHAEAVPFAEQIGKHLTSVPDYNSLLKTYNKVLSDEVKKLKKPDTAALVDMVSKDASAVEAIVSKYFEGLYGNLPPVTLKGGLGAPPVSPKTRAKTLSDAADLAKLLLQK